MIHAGELRDALSGDAHNSDAKEILAKELSQEEEDYEAQKNFLNKTRLIEDELSDYEDKKISLYKVALFKALYEKATAIDELAADNEKEYLKEEQDSKKLQDDAVIGSWGTPASPKTVNGRICSYIGQRSAGKAKINARLKKSFNDYKNIFNTSVMAVLESEVVHKNYEMDNTFSRGLDRCGNNEECLLAENIHLSAITKEGFFDRFGFATFNPVIQESRDNEIPLTDEEIIKIARQKVFHRGSVKLSMESLDDSKKKVLAKLADILNPKKNDEINFDKDLTEDQNDQGALST